MIQMAVIFLHAKSLIPASWYSCNFAQKENNEPFVGEINLINYSSGKQTAFLHLASPSSFFFFIFINYIISFILRNLKINRTYYFKHQNCNQEWILDILPKSTPSKRPPHRKNQCKGKGWEGQGENLKGKSNEAINMEHFSSH